MEEIYPLKQEAIEEMEEIYPLKQEAIEEMEEIYPLKQEAIEEMEEMYPLKQEAIEEMGEMYPLKQEAIEEMGQMYPLKRVEIEKIEELVEVQEAYRYVEPKLVSKKAPAPLLMEENLEEMQCIDFIIPFPEATNDILTQIDALIHDIQENGRYKSPDADQRTRKQINSASTQLKDLQKQFSSWTTKHKDLTTVSFSAANVTFSDEPEDSLQNQLRALMQASEKKEGLPLLWQNFFTKNHSKSIEDISNKILRHLEARGRFREWRHSTQKEKEMISGSISSAFDTCDKWFSLAKMTKLSIYEIHQNATGFKTSWLQKILPILRNYQSYLYRIPLERNYSDLMTAELCSLKGHQDRWGDRMLSGNDLLSKSSYNPKNYENHCLKLEDDLDEGRLIQSSGFCELTEKLVFLDTALSQMNSIISQAYGEYSDLKKEFTSCQERISNGIMFWKESYPKEKIDFELSRLLDEEKNILDNISESIKTFRNHFHQNNCLVEELPDSLCTMASLEVNEIFVLEEGKGAQEEKYNNWEKEAICLKKVSQKLTDFYEKFTTEIIPILHCFHVACNDYLLLEKERMLCLENLLVRLDRTKPFYAKLSKDLLIIQEILKSAESFSNDSGEEEKVDGIVGTGTIVTTEPFREINERLLKEAREYLWKHFISSLAEEEHSSADRQQKVFISYAWYSDPVVNANLQQRLTELRNDLELLKFSVFLDISHMTGDMSVAMRENIQSSDFILFIGTPRFKERASDPTTNLAFEVQTVFEEVKKRKQETEESKKHPLKVLPLLLDGSSFGESFPKEFFSYLLRDFKNPSNYRNEMIRLENPLGVIPDLLNIRTNNSRYHSHHQHYLLSLLSKVPSSAVPFVGREKEIDALSTVSSSIVALHGPFGVGKASLALAYGRKYQEDQFSLFIRMISGSSLFQLENEFRIIANILQINDSPVSSTTEDNQTSSSSSASLGVIMRSVFDVLVKATHWLLIITDVEDDIGHLLPKANELNPTQRIILTTKGDCFRNQLDYQVVEVNDLDSKDSTALILQILPKETEETSKELLKLVLNHPLSIVQLAHLIREKGLSIKRYLSSTAKDNKSRNDQLLLKQQLHALVEMVSSQGYHQFLFLLSTIFFDSSSIPFLLWEQPELLSSPSKVNETFESLRSLSLYSMNSDGDSVNVHRFSHQLFQEIILKEFSLDNLLRHLMIPLSTIFQRLLVPKATTEAEMDHPPLLMYSLLPHAESFLRILQQLIKEQEANKKKAANSSNNNNDLKDLLLLKNKMTFIVAMTYKNTGNYSMAKQLITDLLKGKTSISKEEDPNGYQLATLHEFLGFLCLKINQFPEAKKHFQTAIDTFSKDEGDQSSLITVLLNASLCSNELGEFHNQKMELEKIESLLQEYPNEVDESYYLQYQAIVCFELGDYEQSLELIPKAKDLVRSIRGEIHLEFAHLCLLEALSEMYSNSNADEEEGDQDLELSGKQETIEDNLQQAEDIFICLLKDSHEDFAALFDAQAQYQLLLKQLEKAKELSLKALEIIKKQPSPNKSQLLRVSCTYARVLLALNDRSLSDFLQETRKSCEKYLPNHLYLGNLDYFTSQVFLTIEEGKDRTKARQFLSLASSRYENAGVKEQHFMYRRIALGKLFSPNISAEEAVTPL